MHDSSRPFLEPSAPSHHPTAPRPASLGWAGRALLLGLLGSLSACPSGGGSTEPDSTSEGPTTGPTDGGTAPTGSASASASDDGLDDSTGGSTDDETDDTGTDTDTTTGGEPTDDCVFSDDPTARPVIPFARGYGVEGPIARQTEVYRVTTTDATGPGSLSDAFDQAEQAGGGVIVFEVAGVIDIESAFDGGRLMYPGDNTWIAGQTAPAPGIFIRGGLVLRGDDLLVQHIGVYRPLADGVSTDTISLEPIDDTAGRVVFDHVAVWGANDGNLDIAFYDSGRVTVQHTILATPLRDGHPEDDPNHNYNSLIYSGPGGDGRITWRSNLFTTARDRQPNTAFDAFVYVNNVVYNRQEYGRSIYLRNGYENPFPSSNSIVGNVFWELTESSVLPVDMASAADPPAFGFYADSQIFVDGNLYRPWDGEPEIPGDQWEALVTQQDNPDSIQADEAPAWNDCLEALPADEVMDHVVATAGPRPAERIDFLARLAADVGSDAPMVTHPFSLDEIDAELLDSGEFDGTEPREFVVPDDPHEVGADGYTNLEHALFDAAAAVE